MQILAILLIGLYSVGAKKEDFDGLEELMNNPNLLSELEKRLGALLAEDGLDSEKTEVELPCNATSGTLNVAQSTCRFESDDSLIIKTTESLNRDALFVGKTEKVQCAKDCAMQCCNTSKCDTAVYQNKDEHKCYLFKCSFPGRGNVCVFDVHSNYSVSYMRSKSVSSVPGSSHVSHENDLENLGSLLLKPAPVVSVVLTTDEPRLTTTVRPALGESCRYNGAMCLDPHAECYLRECSCRAGYHNKYGICQRICRKEEFECVNEGLSPHAKQCIHESYRCDGNRDCDDGSDEFNCPKIDDGYKGFPDANIYQKQLFPYPYNNFGYQAPGLSNQQPRPIPANQIYQNQVPANGIPDGQYYIPGLTNQNRGLNLPQTGGSQINNWPFMDSAGSGQPSSQNVDQSSYQNIGQPSNPNNIPYQSGQQHNIGSNQIPKVPVNQNPSNNIQQAPMQAPPVGPKANQRLENNNEGRVVDNNQQMADRGRVNEAVHAVKPTYLVPLNRPVTDNVVETANKAGYHVDAQEKGQDQKAMNHPTNYQQGKQFHILGESNNEPDYIDEIEYGSSQPGNNRRRPDLIYDAYEDQNKNQVPKTNDKVMSSKKGTQAGIMESIGNDVDEYNRDRFRPDIDGDRHSAEDVNDASRGRTYPPATKSRSQVIKPTQSTIPGQKSGHGSSYASERIEDFPIWMQYDGNSQNINAKKGKHAGSNNIPSEADMKTGENARPKPTSATNQRPANTPDDRSPLGKTKAHSDDQSNDRQYKLDSYDFDDTGRFPTHEYPSKSRDRRPGYDAGSYRDRYRDRYHRPSQDSRYPYDNSGYRGRDRVHYPVWDSYREEYYYPDSYESRKGGNSHGLDYEDYRTENHPGHNTDNQDSNYNKPKGPVEPPDHADKAPPVAQPPTQTQDTDTSGTQEGPEKNAPDINNNNKPAPGPKEPEVPHSHPSDDDITTQAPSKTDKDNKETENKLPGEDSKNSNNSETEESEENEFTFFSSEDSQKVESYTDGSQGPIVALALGLAITLILLIFVGCRLRTVKRRLRKGRALHSNEADYLINGMYL